MIKRPGQLNSMKSNLARLKWLHFRIDPVSLPTAGFVLLFSLLVSSILLATGLGISRLMIRQITLASLSRQSQIAFFAADSGLECALHWNIIGRFEKKITIGPDNIYCNGAVIKGEDLSNTSAMSGAVDDNCPSDPLGQPTYNNIRGNERSCFTVSLGSNTNIIDPKEPCVFVIVDKSKLEQTRITSNGFNKCSLTAPDVLQRTLEITLVNNP